MESTGMYWISIWNILEDMGFKLVLVNPYLIKQLPGRKSDVKDAQWIATLLQKGLLKSSLLELPFQEFDMLSRQSNMCLSKMEQLCIEQYAKQMRLLMAIPGICNISAMIVLTETGADMKVFENSSKFSGWTGLRPRNDESAGKYESTATTKGNRFLQAVLVQRYIYYH